MDLELGKNLSEYQLEMKLKGLSSDSMWEE